MLNFTFYFFTFLLVTQEYQTMEQTVRIVSVGELKESTFTTRQGEQKLLVKREFIISNGYDEIVCEMLGDRAKKWGQHVN